MLFSVMMYFACWNDYPKQTAIVTALGGIPLLYIFIASKRNNRIEEMQNGMQNRLEDMQNRLPEMQNRLETIDMQEFFKLSEKKILNLVQTGMVTMTCIQPMMNSKLQSE